MSVHFREKFHVIVWKIPSNNYFGQKVSPLGELYSHVTLTTEIIVILLKHKYILNVSFYTHPENFASLKPPTTKIVLILGEKSRDHNKKLNQQEEENFNSDCIY